MAHDDPMDAVLSALSHAGRRRILETLRERGGSLTSGEIAQLFSSAWSTTTRHLGVLHDAGLVRVERRGRERIYRVQPQLAAQALERVAGALDLAPAGAHSGRNPMHSEAAPARDAAPGMQFAFAMVYVTELPRALAFYTALGFELDHSEAGYARLRFPSGGGELALHRVPDDGSVESPGIRLYFSVGDVDAHYDRLCDQGIEFDFPPTTMDWGARHAYLRDPDGHELSIYTRPAGGAQPTLEEEST